MKTSSSMAPSSEALRATLQQAQDRYGTKPNFLRLPEVKRMTAMSRASVYKRMKARNFPQAIRLGSRLTVWIDLEVQDWIQEQIALGRAK